jgi:hypothetical protein
MEGKEVVVEVSKRVSADERRNDGVWTSSWACVWAKAVMKGSDVIRMQEVIVVGATALVMV